MTHKQAEFLEAIINNASLNAFRRVTFDSCYKHDWLKMSPFGDLALTDTGWSALEAFYDNLAWQQQAEQAIREACGEIARDLTVPLEDRILAAMIATNY